MYSIKKYIEAHLPKRNILFQELEQFAKEHRVPIMEPTGLDTMLQIMRIQNWKRILEIGTAIGYSALRMAEALPNANIVTLELDETRVEQALANIERAGLGARITVLKGNALDLYEQVADLGSYDAIFIDAAKGQYIKFFEVFSKSLTESGCIYSDNVLYKGLVAEEEIENRCIRGVVEKLKAFNQWLMKNHEYDTTIISVGDGLAVSRKKSS